MRELSDKECDVIIDEARDGCNDGFVRLSYVYVRAGYAAGYRAAKAEQTSGKGVIGSPPGHTEGQKMPGPLDHQPPCIERGCANPSLMPESEYCAYHARRDPREGESAMTAPDLAAAVARLTAESVYPTGNQDHHVRDAIRTVLDALEAAQADAARGRALADELSDNYYCECCDRAPAKSVQLALAAIDAAMGEQ